MGSPLRILVVCSGNTCRSPMAGGLLSETTKARGIPAEVRTAGLYPQEGVGVAKNAVEVMREICIDISEDFPKKVSYELVCWADMIIPLSRHQGEELQGEFPETEGKLLFLGRDVEDPYDCGLPVYRKRRDELRELLAALNLKC